MWNVSVPSGQQVGNVDAVGVVFLSELETGSHGEPGDELASQSDVDVVSALLELGCHYFHCDCLHY